MARNVTKHIVHNWGGNILSIHDGIGPPFVIPTKWIFSWKISSFFWLAWPMGGQYHHELIKYCPPSYVLCVSSHFWPFTKVKFVLEKLDKNLGFADPRPPQLGQIPKFFQKLDLKASLIMDLRHHLNWVDGKHKEISNVDFQQEQGATVDVQDSKGNTALHLSCSGDQLTCRDENICKNQS